MPAGQRIKRFYKKVDVIEHPLSHEVKKIDASEKVTLNNLSLSHNKYYGVTLDGRVTKTFYKDNLMLPTRALAVALAEEWESQKESINLKALHLHNFLGKCVRVAHDEEITQYMRDEVTNILENDQICFREVEDQQNDYKIGLNKAQKQHTQKIFDVLDTHFGIRLKIFHNIQMEPQDKSVKKILPLIEKLDPYSLTSLYQVAMTSKSTAIALALIFRDDLEIQEAVNIARVDENYQSGVFGRVEGAHDFDEAHTLTTFATAKTLINLCYLREF